MAQKAPQLIGISRIVAWALMLAAMLPSAARAQDLAAEVYRDDMLTIDAGIIGGGSQVIHFGDALTLAVAVTYDPNRVALEDLDETVFTSAWPPDSGPYLLAAAFDRGSAQGLRSQRVMASFRFQFLDCPDEGTPTCPGDRVYTVPAFTLAYVDLESAEPRTLTFQPTPQALTVMTTIQRDEENQLFPFEVYFPNGGYPDPLTGKDGTRVSLLTAGLALAILTGGIFMWPFRSRNEASASEAEPRWRTQLKALRHADSADEARYLDGLRRCLVWYCNDELGVDPFVWLDLAERGDEAGHVPEDDKGYAKLRALFVELLHNPAGKGDELRSQLENLIAQAGHA